MSKPSFHPDTESRVTEYTVQSQTEAWLKRIQRAQSIFQLPSSDFTPADLDLLRACWEHTRVLDRESTGRTIVALLAINLIWYLAGTGIGLDPAMADKLIGVLPVVSTTAAGYWALRQHSYQKPLAHQILSAPWETGLSDQEATRMVVARSANQVKEFKSAGVSVSVWSNQATDLARRVVAATANRRQELQVLNRGVKKSNR